LVKKSPNSNLASLIFAQLAVGYRYYIINSQSGDRVDVPMEM